jgi:hypothetical protein
MDRRASDSSVKDDFFVRNLINEPGVGRPRDGSVGKQLGFFPRRTGEPGPLPTNAHQWPKRSSSREREGSDVSDVTAVFCWLAVGSSDTSDGSDESLKEDQTMPANHPSKSSDEEQQFGQELLRGTSNPDIRISQGSMGDADMQFLLGKAHELGGRAIAASGHDAQFLVSPEYTESDTDSDDDGDWPLVETPESQPSDEFQRTMPFGLSSLPFDCSSLDRPVPQKRKVYFAEEYEECETWNKEDYPRGWTGVERKEMQETALKKAAAKAKIIQDESWALPEAGPLLFGGVLNLKDYWEQSAE